ncbi:MAG: histidinol-phosphate aminotransferase family protein, partial [Candidatus Brockarchaeota archaeon]|nr:histidinol-phosphate aminotransferase family protein [Candidatus Brockarchaeota archaeon]
ALGALKGISRYPESARCLEEKIASSLGVEADCIVLSSGADRIIELVLRHVARSSKRLVIPVPGFQMYARLSKALGLGAELVALPVGSHEGLRDEVRSGDAVVIGSPNNPDGKVLDAKAVEALLRECAWLVLDEAYAEYARVSFAPLAASHPNLIVMRTFSKAFALAGLRVGYLVASGDVAKSIRQLTGPYEVSSVGIEACTAALDDPEYYGKVVDLTCKNRSKLLEELRGFGRLEVFPSQGNFLLLKLRGADAAGVSEALKQRNVLVRNCSGWEGLDGEFVRVTVGTWSELALFISSLKEVLGS